MKIWVVEPCHDYAIGIFTTLNAAIQRYRNPGYSSPERIQVYELQGQEFVPQKELSECEDCHEFAELVVRYPHVQKCVQCAVQPAENLPNC